MQLDSVGLTEQHSLKDSRKQTQLNSVVEKETVDCPAQTVIIKDYFMQTWNSKQSN